MNDLVRRMLALLDGVEGTYTCRCGRGLKVGLSSELWHVRRELTAMLEKGAEPLEGEEGTRFALLEVDP